MWAILLVTWVYRDDNEKTIRQNLPGRQDMFYNKDIPLLPQQLSSTSY